MAIKKGDKLVFCPEYKQEHEIVEFFENSSFKFAFVARTKQRERNGELLIKWENVRELTLLEKELFGD